MQNEGTKSNDWMSGTPSSINRDGDNFSAETFVIFRLYIVTATPNSNAAQANLREAMLATQFKGELEIIDVSKSSDLALSAGILVTPTLIKITEEKSSTMIGRLDNRDALIRFLSETTD